MTPETPLAAPAAFLADAHISATRPATIEASLEFFDRAPSRFSSLVLVGDLFDFWIGLRRLPKFQARVAEAIRACRRKGMSVFYVEGNRDYAIGRIEEGALFDGVAGTTAVFRIAGRKLLVTHGDTINARDWRYLTWRRFSRAVVAPALIHLLPDRAIVPLAVRTERALRGTNPAGRRGFPENLCREYARLQALVGIDAVVSGHFHRETTIEVECGGKPVRFYSLPCFRDSGRIGVWGTEGKVEFRGALDPGAPDTESDQSFGTR